MCPYRPRPERRTLLLGLVALVGLAAGCKDEDDSTFPRFSGGELSLSTTTPIAGSRVHYRIEGTGIALARVYQGGVEVTSAVGNPITADTMIGGQSTLFGSFVAVSEEAITAKLYGARGETKSLTPNATVLSCNIDGIWEGTLSVTVPADPECAYGDVGPRPVSVRILAGSGILLDGPLQLRGLSTNGSPCSATFYNSGFDPLDFYKLTVTGDTAAAQAMREGHVTTAGGESLYCKASWDGTLTRRVPEEP